MEKHDDQDPYAELWPKLMADPEIGIPGSWGIKYHETEKRYEIFVSAFPGFNAISGPTSYTPEIYKQHIAGLFRRILAAIQRHDHSSGDIPSREILKKFLKLD